MNVCIKHTALKHKHSVFMYASHNKELNIHNVIYTTDSLYNSAGVFNLIFFNIIITYFTQQTLNSCRLKNVMGTLDQ